VLLVATSLASSTAAHAADAEGDPWFGHDKLLHFEATSTLALVGYAGASLATDDRPTRLTLSLALPFAAGIGKELWDGTGRGDASWRDLTWDLVGAASGALFATAIDWIVRSATASNATGVGPSR
jgi:putative lipoprotein